MYLPSIEELDSKGGGATPISICLDACVHDLTPYGVKYTHNEWTLCIIIPTLDDNSKLKSIIYGSH